MTLKYLGEQRWFAGELDDHGRPRGDGVVWQKETDGTLVVRYARFDGGRPVLLHRQWWKPAGSKKWAVGGAEAQRAEELAAAQAAGRRHISARRAEELATEEEDAKAEADEKENLRRARKEGMYLDEEKVDGVIELRGGFHAHG